MDFIITCDANRESGIGEIVDEISGPTQDRFKKPDYGRGTPRLGVVLMCRDPALNFKRRVRFAKKRRTLLMDVMLSLSEMVYRSHQERRSVVTSKLEKEIPEVLRKYGFPQFDLLRFESDLHEWFAVNAT
jgi:hypothetical protein